MKKRGQSVSLFIILALLVIISSAFIYSLLARNQSTEGGIVPDNSLSQQANTVNNVVQDCLEQETTEAKQLFGIREDSKPLIEEHIEAYLPDCLSQGLRGAGIIFKEESAQAEASITEYALLVDVSYPIEIISGRNKQKLSKFNYYMPLVSSATLSLDGWGRTTNEYRILSYDGRAELVIPQNTKVIDSTGAPLTEIMLSTADRNKGGLVNSVVIGMTIYEGLPDGARFEPEATIKLRYETDELMGFPEEELKIGWYDAARGFWWGLPSSIVDTDNKIVSAEISHFTDIGIVGCTEADKDAGKIEFSYKTVLSTESQEEQPTEPESCSNSASGAPDIEDKQGMTGHGQRICQPKTEGGQDYASYLCNDGKWYNELCDSQGCVGEEPDQGKCIGILAGENTIEQQIEESAASQEEQEAMADESCGCLCEGNCRIVSQKDIDDMPDGKGYFSFTIESDGKGCIMEKSSGNGEADLSISLLGSPGDTFGITGTSTGKKFSESEGFIEVDFDNLNSKGLVAGEPIYVMYDMENTDADVCAWSIARLVINGRGITYPPQCAEFSDEGNSTLIDTEGEETLTDEDLAKCTVQDAINTLCGKGDHIYNDVYPGEPNCEKDSKGNSIGFLDPARAPTLNSMISEAMSQSSSGWRQLPFNKLPSRNSVLAKMQELGLTFICGNVGYNCVATDEDAGVGGGTAIPSPDPDALSTSSSCTSWERSLTKDQVKALILKITEDVVTSKGLDDAEYFGKLMIGMATQESGIRHCTSSGSIITGDGGVSIGILQVNTGEQDCTGSNIYRLACNIESSIKTLIEKYEGWGCAEGYTLDCTSRCNELGQKSDCSNEIRVWQGWDCAIRGYNGMGCAWQNPPKSGNWIYCGTDCNSYVEKVKNYAGLAGTSPPSGINPPTVGGFETLNVVCTEIPLAFSGGDSTINTCQESKGVTLDTVSECDSLGGWPIYSVSDEDVTSGRKVCCRQEGCCVSGSSLKTSTQSQCTGTFEKKECAQVSGCCTWEDDGCKKAVSTKQECREKTFFPLESGCEEHPECETAKLGYSGMCHYCGNNVAIAKQIDPNAVCSGRCCEAECPPNTVMVPDTVYYNQCGFGSSQFCGAACGPTSLMMGLETTGHGKQQLAELWSLCGTTSAGTGVEPLNRCTCSKNACISQTAYKMPSLEFFEDQIDQGHPSILLQTLSSYQSEGCDSGGGHFFLVVGYSPEYFIVNDPFTLPCSNEVGEHLVLTRRTFVNAIHSYLGTVTPVKG